MDRGPCSPAHTQLMKPCTRIIRAPLRRYLALVGGRIAPNQRRRVALVPRSVAAALVRTAPQRGPRRLDRIALRGATCTRDAKSWGQSLAPCTCGEACRTAHMEHGCAHLCALNHQRTCRAPRMSAAPSGTCCPLQSHQPHRSAPPPPPVGAQPLHFVSISAVCTIPWGCTLSAPHAEAYGCAVGAQGQQMCTAAPFWRALSRQPAPGHHLREVLMVE